MTECRPLPVWAKDLDTVGFAALNQACNLTKATHTDAERGLILQAAENLAVAAGILRGIATPNDQ